MGQTMPKAATSPGILDRHAHKTDRTLRKVYEEDHALLERNFRAHVNGFSPNVGDIIGHFDYRATIGKMV